MKTDDEYSMFEDDEDNDNYFGDDTSTDEINSTEKEASAEFQEDMQKSQDSHIEDLNYLTELIKEFQSYANYDDCTLRHIFLDCNLGSIAKSQGIRKDDIILSYSLEDVKYMELIGDLYQELRKYLSEIPLKLKVVDRNIMLELLGAALSQSVWGSIEAFAKENNSDAKHIRTVATQLCGGAYYYKKFSASQFVDEVTDDCTDIFLVAKSGLKVLKALIGNVEEVLYASTVANPSVVVTKEKIDPEVEANTARVMNVYKELFEVGFQLQAPKGILTKDGILCLDESSKTELELSSSMGKLFALINELTGDFLIQSELGEGLEASKLRNVDMCKGTTYYPEFQLGNLFGILGDKRVDSWEELSRYVRVEVKQNIKANIAAGKEIDLIVNTLTSCIVVSEFDPNVALKLRINVGNNLLSKYAFEKGYENKKSSIMAGTGNLYHIDQLSSGLVEVIIVFNKAAFNGRPLFAYEAVEDLMKRGRKPSLKEMILGQDTSGKIMTTNLNRQNSCVTLVGAGQRSGKGVLTLNLLGTVLASGNPLVYFDGKPDMAKVLWNLGKESGVNPAAWDLCDSNGNRLGSGAPESIVAENKDIFGVLMYLKGVQLMMAAAQLRATNNIYVGGKDKRPFFIFDEALAVQTTMAAAWAGIIKLAKDKKNTAEDAEWCRTIVEWAENLSNKLIAIINSQLPKSGVSTVWLFQSMQPTSWNAFNTAGMTGDFNILKNPIMSRTSIKLLGKGTADSEYALGNVNIKNNKLITERVVSEGGRHFVYTEAQKITDMSLVKVFKPYLVLNEAENGTDSVEELRNNVSQDVWNAIAPEGSLNSGVGFKGFATLLGAEAIKNLTLGRQFLEEILQNSVFAGKYKSVDEYLYDASPDSFKSLGTFISDKDNTEDLENDDSVVYATGYSSVMSEVENINKTVDNNAFKESEIYSAEQARNKSVKNDNSDINAYRKVTASKFINNDPVNPIKEQPPTFSVERDAHTPPTNRSNYEGIYENPIKVEPNPFKIYSSSGSISCLTSIKQMSEYLLREIKKAFGDLSRIESVEVTGTGLVINNVAFRPKFDNELKDSLPYDIRNKVSIGNIVDLFPFDSLTRFKNLAILRVDNSRLAEGRMRRELCISPKKPWFVLFKKLRNLQELYIGGTRITDEVTAKEYDDNGRGGFDLTEKLRKTLNVGLKVVSSASLEKIWDSKPVRVLASAVGWGLGIKMMMFATVAFGPVGLLASSLAVAGALKNNKKPEVTKNQSRYNNRR